MTIMKSIVFYGVMAAMLVSNPDLYFTRVVTRMDTPKYGETLKFTNIKYQPISVVLPNVYQV